MWDVAHSAEGNLRVWWLSQLGFQLANDDVEVLLYLYLYDPLDGNYAHRRLPRKPAGSGKGVLCAVLAGLTMGYFYSQLMKSITPSFTEAPLTQGLLAPYSALLVFGVGLLVSNLVVNTVFIRAGRVTYREYSSGSPRLHSL